MDGLLDRLRNFNAKERFWLVAFAARTAGLHSTFRDHLSAAAGAPLPADAWWAMDYHLDWLEAAIMSHGAKTDDCFAEPEPGRNLNHNQQDVDLLVGWEDAVATHLVVIEAKGATPWSTSQYAAKLSRLTFMFGADG